LTTTRSDNDHLEQTGKQLVSNLSDGNRQYELTLQAEGQGFESPKLHQTNGRGAGAVMTHALHKLAEVGARFGGELVARVPQVVNVNVFQADGGQRWPPHAPVKLL